MKRRDGLFLCHLFFFTFKLFLSTWQPVETPRQSPPFLCVINIHRQLPEFLFSDLLHILKFQFAVQFLKEISACRQKISSEIAPPPAPRNLTLLSAREATAPDQTFNLLNYRSMGFERSADRVIFVWEAASTPRSDPGPRTGSLLQQLKISDPGNEEVARVVPST